MQDRFEPDKEGRAGQLSFCRTFYSASLFNVQGFCEVNKYIKGHILFNTFLLATVIQISYQYILKKRKKNKDSKRIILIREKFVDTCITVKKQKNYFS